MKKKKKITGLQMGTGIMTLGALSYWAFSHWMTHKLVSIALDRKMPRSSPSSRRLFSGCNCCEELLAICENASACLQESDCETVTLVCKDGERMVGHLRCCKNPKRIIIAMHGWRSSWNRDFGLIDAFWHNADCCILYAEQRGQNNSGGKYIGFGLTERYDCVEWIHWVRRRFGTKMPIYLAGVSMGASTVLMAGGLALPAQVRGIIADCGFTSPYHIWEHVVKKNLHLSYKIRARMADRLCRRRIRIGPNDYSTVEAMKSVQVPVLFIHGAEDHFVPVGMTYENYNACVAPKYLLIVEGADHGMSYLVDPKAYEKAIVSFWQTYDG